MILEKIYERLDMFPTYLKYRLNYTPYVELNIDRIPNAEDTLKMFQEVGYIFFDSNDSHYQSICYTYDEWLFENQYYDLVDYSSFKVKAKGLIEEVKTGGTTIEYNTRSAVQVAKRKNNYLSESALQGSIGQRCLWSDHGMFGTWSDLFSCLPRYGILGL